MPGASRAGDANTTLDEAFDGEPRCRSAEPIDLKQLSCLPLLRTSDGSSVEREAPALLDFARCCVSAIYRACGALVPRPVRETVCFDSRMLGTLWQMHSFGCGNSYLLRTSQAARSAANCSCCVARSPSI
eukprot:scaffold193803_cov32-Tisochrysis_lutea.AAC.1